MPSTECAVSQSEAKVGKRPIDIIFVIDNSGSMAEEIQGVEANINDQFAKIIANSGLDYRVIMLSQHGDAAAEQSICVAAPLSGHRCQPPPAVPKNSSTFFHYSYGISSGGSLNAVIETYNARDSFALAPDGWSQWLRPDAMKVFVEITDDQPPEKITVTEFEKHLFALTPKMFGMATRPEYRWHSIIGIAAKADASTAYLPNEPTVTALCPTGVTPGLQYQELSKRTGGLRFPVCDPSKYSTVFNTIAQGVVDNAQIQCKFSVPEPPPGQSLSNRIVVEYTPGSGGAVRPLVQVSNAAACTQNAFYLAGKDVRLCDLACNAIKTDARAKLRVIFTCESFIN